jgi:hypothetical protein
VKSEFSAPSIAVTGMEDRIAALRQSLITRRDTETERVARIRTARHATRDTMLAKLRGSGIDSEEIAAAEQGYTEHTELLEHERKVQDDSATEAAKAVHAELAQDLLSSSSAAEASCVSDSALPESSESGLWSPAGSGFITPSVDRILRSELLEASSALAFEKMQMNSELAACAELKSALASEAEAFVSHQSSHNKYLEELAKVRSDRDIASERFLNEESMLQHVKSELAESNSLRGEAVVSNEYIELKSQYKHAEIAIAALHEECHMYLERVDPLAFFLKDMQRSFAAGDISDVEELKMLEEFEANNRGTTESKVEEIEASHDHVKYPHPTLSST